MSLQGVCATAGCVIALMVSNAVALAGVSCEDTLPTLGCVDRIEHDAPARPSLPDPGERVVFDAVGTEAIRVTRPGMFDDGNTGGHQYSRRQAWNADETLLDLGDGIVRADDFSVLLPSMPLSSARNWSNLDPGLIYGIRYNPKPTEFGVYDLNTDRFDVLAGFDEFERCTIGDGEGNLSNDDRYVALTCHRRDESISIIGFDIVAGRELGRTEARSNFNWASFTQSGRHVVVENNQADSPMARQIVRYTPDMKQPTLLTEERAHGDLGIDETGRDVLVMMTWKRLWYLDIETGDEVELTLVNRFSPAGHGHVSCRNIKRPGWCYLSSYDGAMGAVKLARSDSLWQRLKLVLSLSPGADPGTAVFEPWGYHYSSSDDYAAEPKASVSPSGTQMVFTSDWSGTTVPSDFVLRPLPAREPSGKWHTLRTASGR